MKRREELILILVIFFTSVTVCGGLYIHDQYSLMYFGDAVSHIVRARQFIDSQQTGFINIGTVWLPLPHLLLIPAVAADPLFYSGIAGAAVGIPLLICTSLLLFSIIRTVTYSSPIALYISLLFGLNPNVIYISITPMSEISLLFFVTLGGYSFLKWMFSNKKRWLVLASGAVLSATLCRYEAWILAPFLSAIVFINGIRLLKDRSPIAAVEMMVIALIPWIGMIFWLGWNAAHYGDMFKFAHWTYSVGSNAVRTALHNNPSELFFIIGTALLSIFGPMMLGCAVMMLVWTKRIFFRKEQIFIAVFFLLPGVFVLTSILAGYVQVDQWQWNWRFVLSFGLFLSIASAFVVQELFQKYRPGVVHGLVALFFFVMPVVQIGVPSIGVAVYRDAKKSFHESSRSAAMLGVSLSKIYSSGTISLFTGYGLGQRIMISSRLPLKTFTIHYDDAGFPRMFSDRFVILGKHGTSESDEFSDYWNIYKDSLRQSYTVSISNKHFVLLEHMD